MSILKEIGKLTQPVFDLPDLEDEDIDGTASRTIPREQVDSIADTAPRLIRKAIDLSINDSSKYGGKKISRNDAFDEFSDLIGLGDHAKTNGSDNSNKEDEDNRTQPVDKVAESSGNEEEELGDNENEETDDSDDREHALDEEQDYSTDEGISDDSGHGLEEDDTNEDWGERQTENEQHNESVDDQSATVAIKDLMKIVDREKHLRKAESVSTQTQTWEQLLYLKIKLQAALRVFNQLPRGQLAKDLLKQADEEDVKNMKIAHENAAKLISSLLEAESLLLAASTFTSSVVGKEGAADSDDEEIESSDDEVIDNADSGDIVREDEDYEGEEELKPPKKSMSVKSLSKLLCESEERFAKFRASTLIKWDGRTRLIVSRRSKNASTDFSAFEKEDIVSQIEKVCADKSRLVKRVHIKKSDVERIGGNPEDEEDEEIFDDDDFYQILLKELIDRKSSNTQDPVAMTRHYIEMQKLKSKRAKKKDIDHRASKERKIKYLPIPKLVNFHPAMPEMVDWNHESRNELFKSLFS